MSSDKKEQDEKGIDRREFLMAGAAGAAGIAAAGVGMNTAWAQPKAPGAKLKTNSKTGIRTAIITDAQLNIGPFLARKFAQLKYNLVIADVRKGLPKELRELGASDVVVVPGIEQEAPNHEGRPGVIQKVVDAAMNKFGGYDSVFIRTAVHHPAGDIFETTAKGLYEHYELMAYSTMRAAANMMCRCAAMTVAPKGVTVNVVGTNFMNYPGFWHAAVPDGNPKAIQKILDTIPMGRLGETEEAAHFTLALLDGHNMYTTGNFFPVAGGFNNAGMEPFGA
jgi:NAD(P)-dependent dehydrogenase (short-subunit alcohol dehydrogenase family)